jgi:tyrosine-protein kinase Etk/Wzc
MDKPLAPEQELEAFDTGVSLGDYLHVVVRRKWAVIVIFVTTVLLATLISLRMPKVYETSVTIKISQRIPGQDFFSPFYYEPNFLQTEIEMVRSRALLARVANKLDMTYRLSSAPPRLREAFSDVSIVEGTPASNMVVIFKSPGAYDVYLNKKPLGEGRVGEPFEGDFGVFTINADNARRGDRLEVQIHKTDAVVATIMSSIKVKAVENVNMVRVTVRGRDPARVAGLSNAIADTYVEASLEEKKLQATSTRKFIEEQIDRIASNLRGAEIDLENFKRETGIVDMDAETKYYVTVLGNLESDLLQSSLDRQLDAIELDIYNRRRAGLASEKDAYVSEGVLLSRFAAGSTLGSIEDRLIELRRKRAELMQTRTADHPSVKAVDAEIEAANRELMDGIGEALDRGELATNIVLADERRTALENTLKRYRELTSTLPEKEMKLNRLIRAYQVNEQVYTMLLEKLQEAKINEAMKTADIRVVDYALVPKVPISPNYIKNILVGVLLGIFLGVGLAYALEFADTSLNTVEEVERRLSRPVIGIIPRVSGGPVDRLAGAGNKKDVYFVAHHYPKSPVAEAFRTLRTAIVASGVDKVIQKVLVTSTGLADGKTTVSLNMANIFAQMGTDVVLVDCDLRRAVIHRAFDIDRVPGLAEVIMGQATLKEALRPTEVENLYVVPSGIVPPNPSELLGSKKFEEVLDKLNKKFAQVVMDAPPVLAVTDALVLSRLTDGVAYVICAGRTDRNAARRGLDLLDRTGCRVLGVVLNQVDMARVFGSYGYKYYSQYYRAYTDGEAPS